MNDFRKENDLDGSQGDLRSLGHPQRPRQAQPWGVQQVPFIFIKMNIWNMFHERFLKRKRSGWVPRWSEGSRTPSATSTSSTMGSTASTIYIHKNEHLKYVSWTIFEKKTIWKLLFKHVQCQIFMIITGTCCTLLSWACRGRWGCPRASWSPCITLRLF